MPPWDNRLSANATLLGSGPQKPDFALAMLEEKLAECLGDEIGMIHAPVSVANSWMNDYVCKESESYEDGMVVVDYMGVEIDTPEDLEKAAKLLK